MKFELDGKYYPIEIERKLGQRNTYIRVKSDLVIHVTTSKLTSNKFIINLIQENYSKIIKMLEIQLKKQENNNGFYYLGKKYKINYIDENKLYLDNGNVYMNKGYDIDKFYKRVAKDLFLERLEYHYNHFSRNIPHPKLRIRKMKSRWGVCNIKTYNITLNLELIKRELKYLDYVIIHELTHLVYGDHSSAFWSVVEENLPNYKEIRKDMKEFL